MILSLSCELLPDLTTDTSLGNVASVMGCVGSPVAKIRSRSTLLNARLMQEYLLFAQII